MVGDKDHGKTGIDLQGILGGEQREIDHQMNIYWEKRNQGRVAVSSRGL